MINRRSRRMILTCKWVKPDAQSRFTRISRNNNFFLFNIGRNAWSIRLDDYFFFFFLMVEGKGNEIYSKVSNKIGEDKLRR